MNRNKTPDILEMIMVDSPNVSPQKISTASNKGIRQDGNKTSDTASNKGIRQVERKEKATFNLSKKVLADLEEAWFLLRKKFNFKNQKITKTLIVEMALKKSLTQIIKKGDQSDLGKEIIDISK